MASRIDQLFERLKNEKRKAFIGYITAGHPTKGSLKTIVPLLEKAGLDLLEIGIPFSDPIADGPTIQRSSQIALNQGTTLPWILKSIRSLRKKIHLPIVFMSYCNPILSMGSRRFFQAAHAAGVDGVIIPDLIIEESEEFRRAARAEGVDLIFMVTPTTPMARVQRISQFTTGFLYAVSLTGVTGSRVSLPSGASTFLSKVKRISKKPVAVGFGIATPEHARQMAPFCDGIIVGSALVQSLEHSNHQKFKSAVGLVHSIRRALDR